MSSRRLLAAAVVLSVALPSVYAVLGGGSYEPPAVADPCEPRQPPADAELVERLVLSAMDGAACRLGVSRESLALALVADGGLSRLAREHDLGEQRVEEAVRAAVLRAIDDAERAGAIGGVTAALLRTLARTVPIDRLIDLIGAV